MRRGAGPDRPGGLATVLARGTAAQWIAWWRKRPSILLRLTFGCAAGPLRGIVEPDRIRGHELRMALVRFSVAIVTFEGGLSLRIGEVAPARLPVIRQVMLGAGVNGGMGRSGTTRSSA